MNPLKLVLPVIVLSQFCCTSLWFAGNAVMPDLLSTFDLEENALGHLTSAVQFGFITGTLVFAIFTIADRYSPSKVFLISALLGGAFNFCTTLDINTLSSLLTFRFFTGFFLAGIYPIGMKIATDYFEKGLGKSLGFLVGALVIGTAFPHLLSGISDTFSWKTVLVSTSTLAALGGVLMITLVPDGPHRNKGNKTDLSAFFKVFKNPEFRSASFGYFGHMWELYAFWAFVPIMLKTYNSSHTDTSFNISILSFLIIAIGGVSCVISGIISQKIGVKRTAFIALLLSGCCCLLSPWAFATNSEFLFIGFLLLWGIVVIADSPLFSTLVAQNAPAEIKGTALTIVNSIGFFTTIISIQVISSLNEWTDSNNIYMILAIGPILGLIALGVKSIQKKTT
jgi:MFS family permease